VLVTGAAATGGPRDRESQGKRSIAPRVRLLAVAAAVLAAILPTFASANPDLDRKRAEAQAIWEQIMELDSENAKAQEAINLANLQLEAIENDLALNRRHLEVAQESLVIARQRVADRLRAIYIEGESGGAVEVILGATSIDDLVNRIELVERVGAQDSQVLEAVGRFRREVEDRGVALVEARDRQEQIVAEREARQRDIAGRLGERQRLYESAKAEIDRLLAEEARRAAQAAEEARRRLAAQAAATAAAQAALEADPGESVALPSPTAFEEAPTVSSAPAARFGGVVSIAMQYLGVPYVYGGMSPSGFDCSGLISYSFAQIGVQLPHHAASQYNYGTPISRSELQPGDLVFFDGLGHAGIYIGGGNFIHAPHTGDVVKISSLYQSWYDSRWVGGRRL
jgi:cell wall-associated NlpC family hydrolase